MNRRGISRIDGRLAHDGPPVIRLACAACGDTRAASGLVRRVGGAGLRELLCYGCYENHSDGILRESDEYWDGDRWVPLREGI
jgi:hypothetical protein